MTRSSGANEQTFLARRGVRIGRDLPQIGPTALASVAAARLVPFFRICVSGRNSVWSDRFRLRVREKVCLPPLSPLLGYFGPDNDPDGVPFGSD